MHINYNIILYFEVFISKKVLFIRLSSHCKYHGVYKLRRKLENGILHQQNL